MNTFTQGENSFVQKNFLVKFYHVLLRFYHILPDFTGKIVVKRGKILTNFTKFYQKKFLHKAIFPLIQHIEEERELKNTFDDM